MVYTDGLVERPGESLADGIARLRQAVVDVAAARVAELADQLLARLLVERRDDACLMVIRPR